MTYAKSLSPDRLVALSVVNDAEAQEELADAWERYGIDIDLQTVYSPYRELTGPVSEFLDTLDAAYQNDILTVILPEFVLRKWWEQLLHNQSALLLKARLLFRRNTVVVSVPFHLDTDSIDSVSSGSVEASGFNEAASVAGSGPVASQVRPGH